MINLHNCLHLLDKPRTQLINKWNAEMTDSRRGEAQMTKCHKGSMIAKL